MQTDKHVPGNVTGTIGAEFVGGNIQIGSPEWMNSAFGFNPTNLGKFTEKFTAIETKAKEFAGFLVNTLPNGYDRALALTKLREATMYAINGIVCASNA